MHVSFSMSSNKFRTLYFLIQIKLSVTVVWLKVLSGWVDQMACLVTTDRAKFDLKTTVLKQHSWNRVQTLILLILAKLYVTCLFFDEKWLTFCNISHNVIVTF